MYCGVENINGIDHTVVSVKVTVDELSTMSDDSNRMKDTCFISFVYEDEWVAVHILCDEQLNIEEEL